MSQNCTPEEILEALGAAEITAQVARLNGEAGDTIGLHYSVRRLAALVRFIDGSLADLHALKLQAQEQPAEQAVEDEWI